MALQQLDHRNPDQAFFPVTEALLEPNGLLAIGGCLSPQRLLNAYRNGIFPWFGPQDPILWWSPDPRMVLFPERLIVSRSLQKTIRQQRFTIRYNTAFSDVMLACAEPRSGQNGTWITDDMLQAYLDLHRLGYAHSVEAWQDQQLVGGLYGVALGHVFFGESMFHRCRDASKVAFVELVQQLRSLNYHLIDCQVSSGHLASLGGEEISRHQFCGLLREACPHPHKGAWPA